MQENSTLEVLTDGLERYIETNAELIKLEATERSVAIGSGLIGAILVGLVGVFALFFASLWVALCLSASMGNNSAGFIGVAGFYFILLIILWLGRKKIIEYPLRDYIIQKVFEK